MIHRHSDVEVSLNMQPLRSDIIPRWNNANTNTKTKYVLSEEVFLAMIDNT